MVLGLIFFEFLSPWTLIKWVFVWNGCQKPHVHNFVTFLQKYRKSYLFALILGAKMPPKMVQRRDKRSHGIRTDVWIDFGVILSPFWSLGGPMRSLFGVKSATMATMVAKMRPKSSQEPLFWPPGGPKACQSAPKAPKGPHF